MESGQLLLFRRKSSSQYQQRNFCNIKQQTTGQLNRFRISSVDKNENSFKLHPLDINDFAKIKDTIPPPQTVDNRNARNRQHTEPSKKGSSESKRLRNFVLNPLKLQNIGTIIRTNQLENVLQSPLKVANKVQELVLNVIDQNKFTFSQEESDNYRNYTNKKSSLLQTMKGKENFDITFGNPFFAEFSNKKSERMGSNERRPIEFQGVVYRKRK